jgi:hypothetical protein
MLLNIIRKSFIYLIRNVNFYFLVIFLYSFCTSVRSNLLVCSFIRNNVIYADFGFFIIFFLIVYTLLFILFYSLNIVKNVNNYDWLLFLYRNYFIFNLSILTLVSYIFDTFRFFGFWLLSFFKSSFFFNFLREIFNNIFCQTYWYPIFKRHSYFGYFRSMRQKWVEVKSEEINRFKY